MINQKLLLDDNQLTIANSITKDTSFIYNSETTSEIRKSKLLNLLEKRNYFGSDSKDWIHRIENCRIDAFPAQAVYDCGCFLDFDLGCNSRICPHCNERYKRNTTKKIGFIIGRMKERRFLTISPKNYTIEEFNNGFALKDLNKIWKNMQDKFNDNGFIIESFVAVREFKFNGRDWNIHLHIVYDGPWIPQKYISKVMSISTKGRSNYSYIKNLSSKGDKTFYGWIKTTKYIAKYIGKFEVSNDNLDRVVDYYKNTKNRRLVTYSQNFDKAKFKESLLKCPQCYKGLLAEINISMKKKTPIYDMINHKVKFREENILVEIEVDSKALIEKERVKQLKGKTRNLGKSHNFLEKIDRICMNFEDNIDLVFSAIGDKGVNYLLERGDIAEIRPNHYEVMR